jgi:hypothetical protein
MRVLYRSMRAAEPSAPVRIEERGMAPTATAAPVAEAEPLGGDALGGLALGTAPAAARPPTRTSPVPRRTEAVIASPEPVPREETLPPSDRQAAYEAYRVGEGAALAEAVEEAKRVRRSTRQAAADAARELNELA